MILLTILLVSSIILLLEPNINLLLNVRKLTLLRLLEGVLLICLFLWLVERLAELLNSILIQFFFFFFFCFVLLVN